MATQATLAALAKLTGLREGVLAPDFYDPSLNPLYRDLLRRQMHDGAEPELARVA